MVAVAPFLVKWLIALAVVSPNQAQIDRLAASFISNFPAYVTWPDEAWKKGGDNIYIGVIGPSPIGQAGVDYLNNRPYRGRTYIINKITTFTPDQLDHYQILLIGEQDKEKLKKLIKETSSKPILTIGNAPDFPGLIHLSINGNAVTFQVNQSAAKKAKLKIDPRLETYGKSM